MNKPAIQSISLVSDSIKSRHLRRKTPGELAQKHKTKGQGLGRAMLGKASLQAGGSSAKSALAILLLQGGSTINHAGPNKGSDSVDARVHGNAVSKRLYVICKVNIVYEVYRIPGYAA